MNLFELTLKLKGIPIEEAKAKLKSIQQMSEADFATWQEQQKWDIIKHHYQHNKHYRDLLGGRMPASWEQVPILTKAHLQKPLEQLISDGFSLKNCYVNNTSGSSGHPFFFAKDKFAHAMTWALIMERYRWHDLNPGDKQARFYGIPLTFQGYYKEKIKDFLANRLRFPVFNLSDEVLEEFYQRFTRIPFKYIYGYTSSVAIFAKYVLQKPQPLNQVCPSLKCSIVTSEACTPEDRAVIEKAFGVPMVNEYGASELDFIAFTDRQGDWLITNETLHFEIVDNNNIPLPDGQEGKVIVSSYFNKAMPFVRYQIGDMGIIAPQRKGKYPVLQQLSGRVNDVALLPSGRRVPGLTFYYVSKSLLEQGGIMKEFVIRQKKHNLFLFEYVAERELNEDEKRQVQEKMDMYLEPGLTATFARKQAIDRPKSGKIKHFYVELEG
ncbi:phenylacetate-CoA ligase [Flexibacter flexilis DSM 6793]|uniref:Phenylacetate-CoA ligase n=1 Tax=Flexibacter flexilis DSM 6793 TaxID=927664 RepID=A0A1I1FQA4_9BACT|nr:phenylacetate--CoA ligase family protein [Flexibacter flexilis]SFB99263.1 phenylacetate-CoA ligase [Flexibacter flexilis DSM 6793]